MSESHVREDLRRVWLTESEVYELERLGDYDLAQYADEE